MQFPLNLGFQQVRQALQNIVDYVFTTLFNLGKYTSCLTTHLSRQSYHTLSVCVCVVHINFTLLPHSFTFIYHHPILMKLIVISMTKLIVITPLVFPSLYENN